MLSIMIKTCMFQYNSKALEKPYILKNERSSNGKGKAEGNADRLFRYQACYLD